MKTILITGASSGIGKETVLLFAKKDWQVAATMRDQKQFYCLPTSKISRLMCWM
jgi:NAD(P)-dependent dehydrogenase (short-subunit alcohol dehydrogenase family)